MCRFTNYNKCTTLVVDVDKEGSYACVGIGLHGNLCTSLNFATNLTKTAPKNKVYY